MFCSTSADIPQPLSANTSSAYPAAVVSEIASLPGMVLAIEPMLLGGGSDDVFELDDGWTIATADGSLAAHVEHTVLVGPNGPEILTQL